MKKLIILLLTITFCSHSFSQSGTVNEAVLYHQNQALDKAKLEIDKAVIHEKTIKDPKAWFYKGLIYTDLSRTEKPEFASLAPNALEEAYQAFKKTKELDPSQGQYYKMADAKLKELYPDFINKGAEEFNMEKVEEANKKFLIAQELNPTDTSGWIYGCYTAEALEDKATLKKNINVLVGMKYKSIEFCRTRLNAEEDQNKKLEIVNQAKADFPGSEVLIEVSGDIYSEQGKYQEALNEYQKLITLMPENVATLTKAAMQYEKLKQTDKALELYLRILSLDKLNFLANYNTAIIYFEQGKSQNEKIHALTVDEYHKKGKEMEDAMKQTFNKAIGLAQTALTQTNDAEDKQNINLIISEINKIIKK